MPIELTAEQSKAVERLGAAAAPVRDPHTRKAYVLVRKGLYRRKAGQPTSEAGDELAETYPAQIESAMRAGWGDPVMDQYDDYAAHRKA